MVTRRSLRLAVLLNLCVMSVASAQSRSDSIGFGALIYGRTVVVTDDAGQETTGRLQRVSPDALTIAVNGQDVVFDRKDVAAVFERGTAVKKGMMFGLVSGPALGLAAVIDGGVDDYLIPGMVVFSAIGIAVGTAVGAMIPVKHRIYERAGDADNFRGLATGRVVSIATQSGEAASGELLRFSGDEITLQVGEHERTFPRTQITSIVQRGDSLKNGMIIGLVSGGVAGFAAGAGKDDCDHTPVSGPAYFTPLDCTAGEKWVYGAEGAAIAGVIGLSVGAGIDKLIVGKRLVYRSPKGDAAIRISVVPSFARSTKGVHARVSW